MSIDLNYCYCGPRSSEQNSLCSIRLSKLAVRGVIHLSIVYDSDYCAGAELLLFLQ